MIDGKIERQDKVATIHNRFDARMKNCFRNWFPSTRLAYLTL